MLGALIAAAIMLQAASPSAASAPAPAVKPNTVDPAVVTAKAKDDPMKIVCHSELPVGSRLPVKRCETKGEADMRKFEDRQMLEKAQGATYHW